MLAKPGHLGRDYAEQFQDQSVVDVYHLRPRYPDDMLDVLNRLVDAQCCDVLDVGCGTGEIARRLAACVERVDAVDFSPAMIQKGQSLPGGDQANLHWICGSVEDVALAPPYGLVTAAASLHWMDWYVVLPRFREVMTPQGCLAIIEEQSLPTPNPETLWDLVRRYSTNREYQPYDLVTELEQRGLFVKQGEELTRPVSFQQTIEDYIESFHARNGFSRDRMNPAEAAAFDVQVSEVLRVVFPDGKVNLTMRVKVTWGSPCQGATI